MNRMKQSNVVVLPVQPKTTTESQAANKSLAKILRLPVQPRSPLPSLECPTLNLPSCLKIGRLVAEIRRISGDEERNGIRLCKLFKRLKDHFYDADKNERAAFKKAKRKAPKRKAISHVFYAFVEKTFGKHRRVTEMYIRVAENPILLGMDGMILSRRIEMSKIEDEPLKKLIKDFGPQLATMPFISLRRLVQTYKMQPLSKPLEREGQGKLSLNATSNCKAASAPKSAEKNLIGNFRADFEVIKTKFEGRPLPKELQTIVTDICGWVAERQTEKTEKEAA